MSMRLPRTRPLVLLADDSATQARQAGQALGAAGFRVRLASNGREALEQARRWQPDLILSDILMPGVDGFALCREVRRDPVLAKTPVILYTITFIDPKDEMFALGLGATRFIVKPADPADLVEVIKATLVTGHAAQVPVALASDEAFLKGYSERLAAKLEQKVAELSEAYRRLQQQSEEALRQAETRYDTLVAQLPAITYTMTLDIPAVPLFVSPQVEGLLGFTPSEWLADPALWMKQLHPDDRERVCAEVAALASGGEHLSTEYGLVARDGHVLWCRNEVGVVWHQSGERAYLQGVLLDATGRKEAEEERTRLIGRIEHERATLEAVIDSMTEGLVLLDAAGQVTYCNAQACRLFDFEPEMVVGKSADEVFRLITALAADPEEALAAWKHAWSNLKERPTFEVLFGGPFRREVIFQVFPVESSNDSHLGVGILLRDVTAERALTRTKDELVSVVSHELRTPLASIVGFSELLLTREFPEPERREFVTIISHESQRLTALINDFLDLQRMESGRLSVQLKRIDIGPLLEQGARTAGPDPRCPIAMTVPADLPLVLADPERIQQVLANLISNARKYSPAGGEIRLVAWQFGSQVQVDVIDRGLGIPAEALPHLFEKFYRVDNSDRRAIKGTGLGLAICRQIVDTHGGRIWVESEGLGQGSRFSFTLRAAKASTAGADVLVVEDDASYAHLLETELAALGLTTAWAESAEVALQWLEAERPRALVLDLLLPNIQGEEFLRRLRETVDGNIPVVVVTVKDLDADQNEELAGLSVFAILRKGPSTAAAAAATVARSVAQRDTAVQGQ